MPHFLKCPLIYTLSCVEFLVPSMFHMISLHFPMYLSGTFVQSSLPYRFPGIGEFISLSLLLSGKIDLWVPDLMERWMTKTDGLLDIRKKIKRTLIDSVPNA